MILTPRPLRMILLLCLPNKDMIGVARFERSCNGGVMKIHSNKRSVCPIWWLPQSPWDLHSQSPNRWKDTPILLEGYEVPLLWEDPPGTARWYCPIQEAWAGLSLRNCGIQRNWTHLRNLYLAAHPILACVVPLVCPKYCGRACCGRSASCRISARPVSAPTDGGFCPAGGEQRKLGTAPFRHDKGICSGYTGATLI